MRILVTGAAGFIGSHLCDALLAQGNEVVGIDNFASGRKENLKEALAHRKFLLIEGSILDPIAMEQACRTADLVFHLAVECVRLSIGDPLNNHEVNATGTLKVLEAARRSGIQRFVYCSSSEVYGNASDKILSEITTLPEPVTVYGASKLVGEYYTKAYHRTYGMKTVIVRPFNTYGPREHHQGLLAEVIPKFIIRALNGKEPMIYGTGKNARDFTYISDTVRGLIAASGYTEKMPAAIFNIAYGKAYSVKEIAARVLKLTGQSKLKPLHIENRPGDVKHLHADTAFAQKKLKYKAEVSFEEGLQRTIQWFRDRYPNPSQLLKNDTLRAWKEISS